MFIECLMENTKCWTKMLSKMLSCSFLNGDPPQSVRMWVLAVPMERSKIVPGFLKALSSILWNMAKSFNWIFLILEVQ